MSTIGIRFRVLYLALCLKRISRNIRSIGGIGEIGVREISSDAARNVPTPSLLTAQNVSFVETKMKT